VWENVLDWEHLPWLHRTTFGHIRLLASSREGWRAEASLRRGGAAFVLDVDPTRSSYGAWFREWLPSYDAVAVQRFWTMQGWSRTELDLEWVFDTRADLEAVVRIELPAEVADRALAGHDGLTVDYAANLWWRQF
jgi:hypothetical protein